MEAEFLDRFNILKVFIKQEITWKDQTGKR